jgi:hypothetical protein
MPFKEQLASAFLDDLGANDRGVGRHERATITPCANAIQCVDRWTGVAESQLALGENEAAPPRSARSGSAYPPSDISTDASAERR